MPGHSVEHQPHLGGFAGVGFIHHPFDFFEFFHQVVLVVQPPRRVNEQQICAPSPSRGRCVEGHRRRVAAVESAHRFDAKPVGPHLELSSCRRPEGVSSGKHHLQAASLVILAQLGDGGGFAHPVDPNHHDDLARRHDRAALGVGGKADFAKLSAAGVRLELKRHGVHQRVLQILVAAVSHILENFFGSNPSHVGRDEREFEVLKRMNPAGLNDVLHVDAQRPRHLIDGLAGLG